ncbi:hypothetical protein BGZ58_000242 [Dissophora ornata]|nr:hypothetical protein BGZ58_000242 [Dissophora ornata]
MFALAMKKRLANGLMEDTYHIEYRNQHNHTLGSLTDIGTRQKSSIIKAAIRSLILQGPIIQRIMQQLTMDYDKFAQIVREGGQELTRDAFVAYDVVYNIWYQITTAAMRKGPGPTLAAIKWMEEFEASKGFTYYDRGDRTNGLYFGFSSLRQLEQLKVHGRVLCFNGTPNVFGHKTNLFTLVLKNRYTGTGIPVSSLPTKSCEVRIIANLLQALRKTMKSVFSLPEQEYDYKPNAIITYQGNTEILAVKSVFPGVPLCLACVEIREGQGETIARIVSFRAKWSDYDELILYLNKNYFGKDGKDNSQEKQRHWMVCYCQVVHSSWNNIRRRGQLHKIHTSHIISCTCGHFQSYSTCCKHIALVQLELPLAAFHREEQWNYETNFELDALRLNVDGTTSMLFNHLLQRINDLEAMRDRTVQQPFQEKLTDLLQQFLALYEPFLRTLPGQSLSNKRHKQCFQYH